MAVKHLVHTITNAASGLIQPVAVLARWNTIVVAKLGAPILDTTHWKNAASMRD